MPNEPQGMHSHGAALQTFEQPEVFVLGAGFSRAIGQEMPLLPELSARTLEGYQCRDQIPGSMCELLRRNIEEGLSYLSGSKPWLRESEILRHRALYLELTQVIAHVLADAGQHTVHLMATEVEPWIARLMRYWHHNRSVVITLNYDTLIESICSEVRYPHNGNDRPMSAYSIYPPFLTDAALRSGVVVFDERKPTFELLKLHGSINWYYSGLSGARGEVIYYVPPQGPAAIWENQSDQGKAAIRDKYPFIVPPVFDKGALLTHETMQSIWFRAGEALRRARRVVFMGYSLPPSDLTIRRFLEENVSVTAPVEVVDRSLALPLRISELLRIPAARIRGHTDEGCIQQFALQLPVY